LPRTHLIAEVCHETLFTLAEDGLAFAAELVDALHGADRRSLCDRMRRRCTPAATLARFPRHRRAATPC